jgi:hypothetical protein
MFRALILAFAFCVVSPTARGYLFGTFDVVTDQVQAHTGVSYAAGALAACSLIMVLFGSGSRKQKKR